MRQGASEQADRAVAQRRARGGQGAAADELVVSPIGKFPTRLAVGHGQAFFVDGTCSHPTQGIRSLEIKVGDRRQPVIAFGMAPPFSVVATDYWWAIVTIPPVYETRTEWIELIARLDDGSEA